MKNILKAWLRPNNSTPDPNDYNAVPSPAGNVDFDGVIDEVMSEDTGYQRETVEDIAQRFLKAGSKLVLKGYHVNTGQCHMRAVITGTFYDRRWDPEQNNIYVSITQGTDLHQECAGTTVEILGVKTDLPEIICVTNLVNKKADNTLPRGRNVLLEGSCLELENNHPDTGIYLINSGSGVEFKLTEKDIIINEPSRLAIFIPVSIPDGAYRIRIVSRHPEDVRLRTIYETITDSTFTIV